MVEEVFCGARESLAFLSILKKRYILILSRGHEIRLSPKGGQKKKALFADIGPKVWESWKFIADPNLKNLGRHAGLVLLLLCLCQSSLLSVDRNGQS